MENLNKQVSIPHDLNLYLPHPTTFLSTHALVMVLKLKRLPNAECPLCHKPLTSTEYNRAHLELESKIKQEYESDIKAKTESLNKEIKDLNEKHRQEEKNRETLHKKEIENLQKNLESGYQNQADILEKNYDKMIKDNEKRFSAIEKSMKGEHRKTMQKKTRELKSLEKELKTTHKKELAEKAKQIQQLNKEQESDKKETRRRIKEEFDSKEKRLRADLAEKDIQINRVNKELEELRISKKQSELKGEAGELDLYTKLTHEFSMDFFRRQKRGTSSGDLIQQIRTPTGSVDTPIVYDNKSSAVVTKKDVEKANKYKKTHATNYVIIVSNNLPKTSIPNGLYGEQNGILLVHPKIIIEVVKQIRSGIIEISKLSNSKKDQQAKQYKLYEYIISNEFSIMLESFYKTNEDMFTLQAKEERDHETLWKTRKSLHAQLQKAINGLSSGIESITQHESILEKH